MCPILVADEDLSLKASLLVAAISGVSKTGMWKAPLFGPWFKFETGLGQLQSAGYKLGQLSKATVNQELNQGTNLLVQVLVTSLFRTRTKAHSLPVLAMLNPAQPSSRASRPFRLSSRSFCGLLRLF